MGKPDVIALDGMVHEPASPNPLPVMLERALFGRGGATFAATWLQAGAAWEVRTSTDDGYQYTGEIVPPDKSATTGIKLARWQHPTSSEEWLLLGHYEWDGARQLIVFEVGQDD